jgi:uncharacterized Zn-finger protein
MCPYRSRDSSQLTVHLRTHTNDRPFVCPHDPCTSAFKTNSDLKRHVKLHSCPHCPYMSGNQGAMKLHLASNHKDLLESLKCSECDFRTDNKATLKSHEKSHALGQGQVSGGSGSPASSKKFKCDQCSDFFTSSKLALTSHLRKIHHNPSADLQVLNKHKCGLCDFKAKSDNLLTDHIKRKHAKKLSKKQQHTIKVEKVKKEICSANFNCNLCDATFVRNDSFKSHLRQHQHQQEEQFQVVLMY